MRNYKDILTVIPGVAVLVGLVFLFQHFEEDITKPAHMTPSQGRANLVHQGKRAVRKCIACHDMTSARRSNRVGPPLWGIFNKPAAGTENYKYSKAHTARAKAGLIWNHQTLDAYLKNPKAFIPGNRMAFAGIRVDEERRQLIAYMETLRDSDEESSPPLIAPPQSKLVTPVDPPKKSQEEVLKQGRLEAEKCGACHDLGPRKKTIVGPPLWGITGEVAGQAKNFPYSPEFLARVEKGLTWNEANMDAWLKDPKAFLPGTRMLFGGIPRRERREELITYLKTLR
ncbi:MAG: c-type cytochrome [Magnetococcales bacterium]|nr:c-type cytochrome [Magnetococcales bacterium]